MLASSFSQLVLYFIIYSILGWICETITCSVSAKRVINRGFLEGPYCPVYGFGAVLVLFMAEPFKANPIIIFLLAMMVVTVIEYFTGWLLEKLLHTKLWDYSKRKLNYKGRICLRNSLIFGLMGTLMIYLIHPSIETVINLLSSVTQRVLASVLLVILFVDVLKSISSVIGLHDRLKALRDFFILLENYNDEYKWYDKHDLTQSLERLRIICNQDIKNENAQSVLNQFEAIVERKDHSYRVIQSYPNLQTKGLSTELYELKKHWEDKGIKPIQHIKENLKAAGRKTVSVAKEYNPFAADISFYKMVWVFIIGSVLGYLIETVFCYVTKGVIESRQGLLYGPFSQIYGMGAVIMVLFLTPFAKKSDRWVFLGGALLGGGFEYLCSLIQEKVFGSVSWEYSNQKFHLGGRTSLMFMLFWGILGVIFMKHIYPKISNLIKRISKTRGVLITWILILALSADMILSAGAVLRWKDRIDGVPAKNEVSEFLDKRYPDDFMEEIYPNMKMLSK